MLKKLSFFCLIFLFFSCGNDNEREEQIAEIPIDFGLKRFDERFANATPNSLQQLKKDFPLLFPKQTPDSIWVNLMTDTIQLEINEEVAKEFSDFSKTKQELHQLFQHIKYYFPETKIPEVITLTSYVDYKNKAVWQDDLLLISLDTYLGKDHHFYLGIQEYLKKNFEQEQIIPDVTTQFAETLLDRPDSRMFLAHLIYYGKILYLKELLIPFKTHAQKIGYTPEELDWAKANEEQIWRYFVENELLFASDSELYSRFLYPGPFSKFYLRLDSESPAMLGQFIGWQMVRQYMEETEVSIKEMLDTPAEVIFNESNYKPNK